MSPWRAHPAWLAAAAAGALLLVALLGDNGVLALWRLRAEVAALQRQVQALEAENDRLTQAIAELRDDPGVLERLAREELGLVRPGERVLRFPRSPRAGDPPGPVPRSP
jgi:cell division protein FtsB